MSGQFLAVHVDAYDDDRRTPIAAERTRDAAQALGIKRVLGLGITDGSIAVVEQRLSEGDFARLKAVCDGFARERGLALS